MHELRKDKQIQCLKIHSKPRPLYVFIHYFSALYAPVSPCHCCHDLGSTPIPPLWSGGICLDCCEGWLVLLLPQPGHAPRLTALVWATTAPWRSGIGGPDAGQLQDPPPETLDTTALLTPPSSREAKWQWGSLPTLMGHSGQNGTARYIVTDL